MVLIVTALQDIHPEDCIAGMGKGDVVLCESKGELLKTGLMSSLVYFEEVGEISISNDLYVVDEEQGNV